MTLRFILSGILFLILCTGCLSPHSQWQGTWIDNGCLKIFFIDPEASHHESRLGYRFVRAGWIGALYPAGTDESIFREDTLFKQYATFGFTQEFLPALQLGETSDEISEQLQIGVGIVEHSSKARRFDVKLRKMFPWKYSQFRYDNEHVLLAHQTSEDCAGYSYHLTVKIRIPDNIPIIILEQTLKNQGQRQIDVLANAHPFFNISDKLQNYWYLMPKTQNEHNFMPPENSVLPKLAFAPTNNNHILLKSQIPQGYDWVAAGNFTEDKYQVIIASDKPLAQTEFWRERTRCFAVEPYVMLNIKPGESQSWTWYLWLLKS